MRIGLTSARRITKGAEAGAAFVSLMIAVLLTASAPFSSAQPPAAPPVFRSGTRLIVETVSVKDKDGRPIEGLSAKDFVVTEDGEPQTISFVEFQRLPERRSEAPISGSQAPRVVPRASPATQGQIIAPPPGDARYRDRRLLVLYFDLTA